jgi:hypothetical protein
MAKDRDIPQQCGIFFMAVAEKAGWIETFYLQKGAGKFSGMKKEA